MRLPGVNEAPEGKCIDARSGAGRPGRKFPLPYPLEDCLFSHKGIFGSFRDRPDREGFVILPYSAGSVFMGSILALGRHGRFLIARANRFCYAYIVLLPVYFTALFVCRIMA